MKAEQVDKALNQKFDFLELHDTYSVRARQRTRLADQAEVKAVHGTKPEGV